MALPPDDAGVLKLEACPHCDYSLATLPPEGICPECGEAYDQRYIVLTGLGRGPFDHFVGGTWRSAILQVIGVLFLMWLFSQGSSVFSDPFWILWSILIIFPLAAAAYVRLFSTRDPKMQLWLSPEGFVQAPSTREAYQAGVVAAHLGSLFMPAFIIIMIFSAWPRLDRWTIAASLVVIGVHVCVIGVRRWLRRRRVAATAAQSPHLTPWSRVERHVLKRLSNGRFRIRLISAPKLGPITITEKPEADIEVTLSQPQEDQLEKLIWRWRRRSDVPSSPDGERPV